MVSMKKCYLVLSVLCTLLSCGKVAPLPPDPAPLVFNFTVSVPDDADTKAKKADWVSGDVIYVFFSTVAAPKYLKMYYDGSAWSYTQMNGASAGSLGLTGDSSGNLRAVYLPFGSDATVGTNEGAFTFTPAFASLYWTSEIIAYTVVDNTITATLSMKVPENYVQFYMDAGEENAGDYTLATGSVKPVTIQGVDASLSINLVESAQYSDPLPAYAYNSGGFLFSGKMDPDYTHSHHYFVLKNTSTHAGKDLLVTGKTLSNHSSVKLPGLANDRWKVFGGDVTVSIAGANWYTCNKDQTEPGQLGQVYNFSYRSTLSDDTHALPSTEQFSALIALENKYPVRVNRNPGLLFVSGSSYLFLPMNAVSSEGCYMSSADYYYLYLTAGSQAVNNDSSVACHVRCIKPDN